MGVSAGVVRASGSMLDGGEPSDPESKGVGPRFGLAWLTRQLPPADRSRRVALAGPLLRSRLIGLRCAPGSDPDCSVARGIRKSKSDIAPEGFLDDVLCGRDHSISTPSLDTNYRETSISQIISDVLFAGEHEMVRQSQFAPDLMRIEVTDISCLALGQGAEPS